MSYFACEASATLGTWRFHNDVASDVRKAASTEEAGT